MIIVKRFTTRIVLKDPREIYNENKNAVIIDKLTQRYKNKTYQSSLILEILQINRRSEEARGSDLDGNSYIDVDFNAKVLIYFIGEVIPNCKIIRASEYGAYYCESDYTKIELKADKYLNLLHKNVQYVPVVVNNSLCGFLNESITVISTKYKPEKHEDHYFIVDKNDNTMIKNSDKIDGAIGHFNKIKKLLDDTIKENKNGNMQFKSFLELFYPYKK